MSRGILGQTFDIHGGGLDLLFPHHENELAQSRCCHDKPMVTYWMHNGLMRASNEGGKVGGKSDRTTGDASEAPDASVSGKISRSKGAGGLAGLISKHTGERIRFFLLRTHYRSTSVFGDEPLAEAGSALETFYRLFERAGKILGCSVYEIPHAMRRSAFEAPENPPALLAELIQLRSSFLAKMDDDFNTGGATADLFEMARALNRFIDQSQLDESPSEANREALRSGLSILREMASLLGIFRKPVSQSADSSESARLVQGLMELVIHLRAEARTKRDFATSDAIRDGLKSIGVSIQDGKQGTTWESKTS
jgi:cysteinyl-tRNA synthetase